MQTKPLDELRAAHRSALEELELLEKGARGLRQDGQTAWESLNSVFTFFDEELKVHFSHEEDILFPYLAQVIGWEGPINTMLEEHQTLWRTWDAFVEKVVQLKASPPEAADKMAQTVQQIADHIVGFLRSHIQKEDSVLFPLAEQALPPRVMQEVVNKIQSSLFPPCC